MNFSIPCRAPEVGGKGQRLPGPGEEGVVEVEVTATDASGQTATVRFDVPVDYYHPASPTRGWRRALLDDQR